MTRCNNSDTLLQVSLPVYLAGMLKRMKVCSMMQEARLRELKHPGLFPSKPIATCRDWDCLQECEVDTLLHCKVLKGDDSKWGEFVSEVTADADNFIQACAAISRARRVVNAWSHARVILMPTQSGL